MNIEYEKLKVTYRGSDEGNVRADVFDEKGMRRIFTIPSKILLKGDEAVHKYIAVQMQKAINEQEEIKRVKEKIRKTNIPILVRCDDGTVVTGRLIDGQDRWAISVILEEPKECAGDYSIPASGVDFSDEPYSFYDKYGEVHPSFISKAKKLFRWVYYQKRSEIAAGRLNKKQKK